MPDARNGDRAQTGVTPETATMYSRGRSDDQGGARGQVGQRRARPLPV